MEQVKDTPRQQLRHLSARKIYSRQIQNKINYAFKNNHQKSQPLGPKIERGAREEQ
jgi:hypothetical protein